MRAAVRRPDPRRSGRYGAPRGGTLRLRDHPALLSDPAGLPCDLSREELQSRGAGPGEYGERDAAQQPGRAAVVGESVLQTVDPGSGAGELEGKQLGQRHLRLGPDWPLWAEEEAGALKLRKSHASSPDSCGQSSAGP